MDVLTKNQEQVLRLITKEFLTVKKIALLRKISVQAVYKTINQLKKKGLISGNQLKGFKNTPTSKRNKNQIRLHGVSFKIKILQSSKQYQNLIKNINLDYLNNHTLKLYKETIILHINQDFIYDDVYKCSAECFKEFNKILLRLENNYKIDLVKPRHTRTKLLSWHFAETNNELAKQCNDNKDKLKIYAKEDGTLWFVIDNSFNLNEAETLHPKTAERDMERVKAHFNDIRDNNLPLSSEMFLMISQIVANQSYHEQNIKSHVKAIKTMSKSLNTLTKTLKKIEERLS